MKKTLGGERLGSGNKMQVDLHNYERSTHDLSYVWRSSMSSGTLVPFLTEIALPGDTFDIELNCAINTHPTIGPLFGSYKVQLDVFQAPIRLYNSWLHNNRLGIGLDMSQIKFPLLTFKVQPITAASDLDNAQINPSCILNYLGLKGLGITGVADTTRWFNALPLIIYWDTYKNYYANKVEEIGAVIHTPAVADVHTVNNIKQQPSGDTISTAPSTSIVTFNSSAQIVQINFTGTQPIPNQILFNTIEQGEITAEDFCHPFTLVSAGVLEANFNYTRWGTLNIKAWYYRDDTQLNNGEPSIATFPLSVIDQVRDEILQSAGNVAYTPLGLGVDNPYEWVQWWDSIGIPNGKPNTLSSQEGLGLKTYQSDLFNNWINTEWIDGAGGITEVTSIDTTGGSFTIDTLNLAKKVYLMMNRIAVSGGTYDDWLDAVYVHERYTRCETPMYMGGLIKELVFQEIFSNSQSGDQPLGTLAGKGTMSGKHKGGNITIKVDEPSYIMGIISLTPRIDYSQGNKWDTGLLTMDDLHKPQLDEIGFQELITEQMAWWDTHWNGTIWEQNSAGKQPAWINYMTNVNQVKGNFAIANNEMFMTLNRRYTPDGSKNIEDLTTYIDPSKFNFIFAETALDSQNFWAQIGVNMIARRKMSAKIMPNL